MSVEALVWAFGLTGPRAPTLGTRLTLLVLADNAGSKTTFDDAHVAWPSIATIARKAVLSERQVQRALKWLADEQLITRVGVLDSGVRQWRLELAERRIEGGDNLSGVTPTSPGGDTGVVQNPKEPSEEKADAFSSENGDERENGNTEVPPADDDELPAVPAVNDDLARRYADPKTDGAAAAPWLVLELARLMRANDEKVKLPRALSALMAPEYMASYAAGSFVSVEARRELFARAGWHASAKAWLDAARLLVDADERDRREVAQVLRWSQADDFWKGNIESMTKFRKQYARLRAGWLRDQGGGAATRPGDRRPPSAPATAAQLDALTGRTAA